MSEPPREPFFGRNAKPWAIQMAFLIFFLVVLAGPLRGWLDRHMRPWFNAGFDGICTTTGWCTPEAAERTRASAPRQ